MNKTQSTTPPSKPYLLIDTCVIQLAGHKDRQMSDAVIGCLTELLSRYRLAISEITVFENLQGLWGQKATKATRVLKSFEWKTVTLDVLVLASILGGLYRKDNPDSKYIDTGDKIIASTSLLLGGFVLTNNHRDFPSPFFVLQEYRPVSIQKGHYMQTIDLCVYKPNLDLINRRVKAEEKS